MTRRDKCYATGRRAELLNKAEAAQAWSTLAHTLTDTLSLKDLPKFEDLLQAIRSATVAAKHKPQ